MEPGIAAQVAYCLHLSDSLKDGRNTKVLLLHGTIQRMADESGGLEKSVDFTLKQS